MGNSFEQADCSTTRRFGGSGLGVAICRRLATAMGGSLSIESTLGAGTTVTVTIALLSMPAPTQIVSPAASFRLPVDVADGAPISVLLVDDNELVQVTVRTMLDRLGAMVDTAADGEAAIEKASTWRYDLILMDVQMPLVDGFEATRRIRTGGGPSAATRIVALTANAFTEDTERCLAAGMDAHLTKPVRRATLVKLLRSVQEQVTIEPGLAILSS
jgi:CheY-like chemotaxis protein